MVTTQEFLDTVWSRSKGQWVFLPTMRYGKWTEGPAMPKGLTWEKHVQPPETDHYFTPLSYISPQRKAGNLGDPGVLFADMDTDVPVTKLAVPPTAVVQTSPGHSHLYWFLRNPVAPQRWASANKALTSMIGADLGGWDATQVLRVPGTTNHSKDRGGAPVRLVSWNQSKVYEIDDFPHENDLVMQVQVEATPPVSKRERDYLIKAGLEDDRLPLAARYWLTASTWEIEALGSIDRSKIMWGLEKNLLAHGYTPYEVFQLVHHSPINKWVSKPDQLWREVCKAAGI